MYLNRDERLMKAIRRIEEDRERKRPKPAEATHDKWTDVTGTEYWTHRWKSTCRDGCAIHAPSEHSMVDWPQIMRADKRFLVERICKHGCGHPDPDSISFFEEKGVFDYHDHPCDGCCSVEEIPTKGTANTRAIPNCDCARWDCSGCNPHF